MTPKYSKLPFAELFYDDAAENILLLLIPLIDFAKSLMK